MSGVHLLPKIEFCQLGSQSAMIIGYLELQIDGSTYAVGWREIHNQKLFLKSTKATATTLLASIAALQVSERCTSNSLVERPSR